MAYDRSQDPRSILELDAEDPFGLSNNLDSFIASPQSDTHTLDSKTYTQPIDSKAFPGSAASELHPCEDYPRHSRYHSQESVQSSESSLPSPGALDFGQQSSRPSAFTDNSTPLDKTTTTMADFKMEDGPNSPGNDTFMNMDDSPYLDSTGLHLSDQSQTIGMGDISSTLDFNSDDTSYLSGGLFGERTDPMQTAFRAANHPPSANLNGTAASSYQMSESPIQQTVQPSRMFQVGSREDSPNSAGFLNSNEGSPAPLSTGSPTATHRAAGDGFNSAPPTNYSNSTLGFDAGSQQHDSASTPAVEATDQSEGGRKYPCQLTVDKTPEKSRVETQIPIKLTLTNVPAGVNRVHLPSHTISKPKFQVKPYYESEQDILELHTLLVCASAMQKPDLLESAKERALSGVVPFRKTSEESPQQGDENDPEKPLNGGPVTICPGCIIRERKRAARKKTKKVEEEEEWAKDEAKRVIVFNCPELRDMYVAGTKDVARKDHPEPASTLYINAPMRIACYCRHQNEKVGFRVIFTIKDYTGKVMAQAVSSTIMITDDHKQPAPGATQAISAFTPQTTANLQQQQQQQQVPQYQMQQYQMTPTFQHSMPFRTSFSTNDLTKFNTAQFPVSSQQPGMPAYQRQSTYSNHRSNASTASATPRNLSRPASPTDPSGHSTKKRRSGGISKVPSGLTMTRLDTANSPSAQSVGATTPLSSGPPSSAYSFTSPVPQQYGQSFDPYNQAGSMSAGQFQSGPSTPHAGSMNYGSPTPIEADQYQYFSAPTSQHASRAPSPNPQLRMSQQTPQFSQPTVPQAAAGALNSLPAGLNLQRPPQIQKVLPEQGPRSGGSEVTLLGSGFTQSLEVMFGDQPSPKVTWWAETTIVAVTPPAAHAGPVEVCFKHQHRNAPSVHQQLQGLMPTRRVYYNYVATEQDQNQVRMQQLSAGILQAQQHGGIDPSRLNQGGMMNGVLPSSGQYSNFMSGQMGQMPNR